MSASFSVTLAPVDRRCRWWSKIVTDPSTLDVAATDGAGSIPGAYQRAGSDHDLAPWTAIFDGEANHYRRADRGWTFRVGVVRPDGDDLSMTWIVIRPAAQRSAMKADTTTNGTPPDLHGTGDHAAMVRAAAWILGGETEADRLARLAIVDRAR